MCSVVQNGSGRLLAARAPSCSGAPTRAPTSRTTPGRCFCNGSLYARVCREKGWKTSKKRRDGPENKKRGCRDGSRDRARKRT